jgi:hypothetical protein
MKSERFKTFLISAAAAAAVYGDFWVIERAVPVASAQQTDIYLSRRVDQMEQRFYSIESRLSRIEQEQMRPREAPRIFNNPASESDINLLRTQVDNLRLRMGEAECAILRLDERTLSSTSRLARGRAALVGTERCRQDTGRAIELSARP